MEKVYKLFANCMPIKGFSRSVICDLQRNKYQFIPNSLFEILQKFDGQTIENIKLSYDNKYDEIIDEYYNLLIENEFVLETTEPTLFPPLDLKWENPSFITNAIICFDETIYKIGTIAEQLNNLICKALQLRFFKTQTKHEIVNVLNYFKDSRIQDIELIMPYDSGFTIESFKELFDNNQRLSRVLVFNAPENKQEYLNEGKTLQITFTQLSIKDNSFCGNIHPNNFVQNLPFFTESLHYNTCLNRKLCIDENGYIKNCPSMEKYYGHIDEVNLEDVVKSDEFQQFWTIKKDDIEVCKDCEFRHMCMDCRAYIKDPKDMYSQPAKCTYNPYIAKWKGQDGYISVENYLGDRKIKNKTV